MRATPVWTDPDFADLLAQEPELVAIADAVQQTRAARPARRRRLRTGRLSAAAAGIATAAATTVLLLVPWNGSGQAAVLQRVRAALTPRPGWILHERDVTRQVAGANGRPVAVVSESWTRYAAPYPYRELIRRPGSPVMRVSGTATTGRGRVFHDPAADLRQAVIDGKAAIAGRATYPGRTIYRIVPTTPQRDGLWIAFVDGTTFRPIRFDSSGPIVRGKNGVAHPTTSVTTVTRYEYLPPTTVNLRLAGVHLTYRDARP